MTRFVPADIIVIILRHCFSWKPGAYGSVFGVCKRWRDILESLEKERWPRCLDIPDRQFKWVGIVNASAFHHAYHHAWRHLNVHAPISPLLRRSPEKPTAFFRMLVGEALEDAEMGHLLGSNVGVFRTTRRYFNKRGLFQDSAIISATYSRGMLVYSVVCIANGKVIVNCAQMHFLESTLGLDNPLAGPQLDKRYVRYHSEFLAEVDRRLDLSYLLIIPVVKHLNAANKDRYWYAKNPTMRYMPGEEREREVALVGLRSVSTLSSAVIHDTNEWPEGSYKLLYIALMPKQTIVLIVHRHG